MGCLFFWSIDGLASCASFESSRLQMIFRIPAVVFMGIPKLRDCAVPSQYCVGSQTFHQLHKTELQAAAPNAQLNVSCF
jgi:hypothetical protein